MGKLVGEEGFRPDPAKIRAISDFPVPECREH